MVREFPCIESTTDIKLGNWTFRIWRNQTELLNEDKYDNKDVVNCITDCYASGASTSYIIEKVAQLEKINAIQVIDNQTGKGTVVYTVSF